MNNQLSNKLEQVTFYENKISEIESLLNELKVKKSGYTFSWKSDLYNMEKDNEGISLENMLTPILRLEIDELYKEINTCMSGT